MRFRIGAKSLALGVFALAALVQFYPLSLHPARGLNDLQDCLLNTWIMGWGHHELLRHPLQLFQANAFYPNVATLAYSEHLLPLTLFSLPVSLVSSNPVLAYNFIFFLCCILNAYAMFLLVRHLTGNASAGIVAGVIFAFSATLMQQLAHLQLLAAWFIPLAFLWLQKYIERGRVKHAVLFAACVAGQALACVYYGLFLISVLAVVLPVALWMNAEKVNGRFLARLGLPLLGAGLIVVPLTLPYFRLFEHFQFARPLARGAEIQNYLAVTGRNVLWGPLLHGLGSNERYLFPGVIALALAVYFLLTRDRGEHLLPRRITRVLAVVSGILAGLTALILVFNGVRVRIGPLLLSARNPGRPALGLLVVLSLWFAAGTLVFLVKRRTGATETQKQVRLTLVLVIWSLFLSFGSGFALAGNSPFNQRFHGDWISPFHWFYSLAPGFKGIREPSRYAVFVVFGAAILAGLGWKALTEHRIKPRARVVAAGLVVLALNLEFLSVPQKLDLVPKGRDIPPAYLWLKDQPGDFAVVDLPFFKRLPDEAIYMYFSLTHDKRLVNGYSGFIPPSTDYLRALFREFPSWGTLDVLQKLRVKYVIYHLGILPEEQRARSLRSLRKRYRSSLRLVGTFPRQSRKPSALDRFFEEDLVFEILTPLHRPRPERSTLELSAPAWTVTARVNPELVPKLRDGLLETAWTTGRAKKSGDFINIILDKPRILDRIEIPLGTMVNDWAVNLQVNASLDGRRWRTLHPGYSAGEFALNLVENPRDPVQTIRFPRRRLRYLKIIQRGRDAHFFWSIPELRIFVPENRKAAPSTAPPRAR
jgi:hypothetical protein